jgi:inhibitor of KinA sporulation pathway (predicted exonuclease)
MSFKLDQILVIDIEATCWQGQPPEDQQSEIIEVGICPIEIATGKILEKQSIIVKPQVSKVSEFCTQLTTLTQVQVDQGITFAESCQILRKQYLSSQRVWASYGEYDKNQFTRQCQSFGVKYPFSSRHLNVKTLFAIMHNLEHEVGMAQALDLLNLPLEGTHHRGDDDAGNIARILCQLINRNNS